VLHSHLPKGSSAEYVVSNIHTLLQDQLGLSLGAVDVHAYGDMMLIPRDKKVRASPHTRSMDARLMCT
jgi:hypothetical protein